MAQKSDDEGPPWSDRGDHEPHRNQGHPSGERKKARVTHFATPVNLLGTTDKRVILLYRRELEQKVSLLISGNSHANCTLMPYDSVEEVENFITGYLR